MIWILTDGEEDGLVAFQYKPEVNDIRHLLGGYLKNYVFTDEELDSLLELREIEGESGDTFRLFPVNEMGIEVGRDKNNR
jgi:hypothetical protein